MDDIFKAGNHILSIVSKANGMIGWMVSNISKEVKVVLKIYKTLKRPHIEYCTQAWAPVLRHRNWSVILRLKTDKNNFFQIKDYNYRKQLEILALNALLERRMRGDLIETFIMVELFFFF